MSEVKMDLEEASVPFYPDHFRSEVYVVIGIMAVVVLVGLIGMLSPVGIGSPADPMDTPAHVKPEWYFLALYQILKYVPKTAGAVAPVLALLLVFIWPFLDRKPERSKKVQRTRLVLMIIFLIVFVALTIWGEVS
jgi:cytochrome b6-f complex subunit 4